MITKIVTNVHFLNLKMIMFSITVDINQFISYLSIFIFTFNKNILEKVVIMLLHLLVSHICEMRTVCRLGRILWIDVEIGEENGLGESGLVVNPAASFSMSAGSYKY